MKRIIIIAAILAAAIAGGTGFAQSTAPASSDAVLRIQDVVKRLGDEDFAVRQKASAELPNLPPEAYDLFIHMIADPSTDPEVRARLTDALPALEVKSAAHIVKVRLQEDQAREFAIITEAYDRMGRKDPSWDAAALDGFKALYDPTGTADKPRAIASFRKAVDAGCEDPMVKHLLAGSLVTQAAPDLAAIRRMIEAATQQYVASGGGPRAYPAILRFEGLLFLLQAIPAAPGNAEQDTVQRDYSLQQAFGLWPEVVNTPGLSSRKVHQLATALLDRAEKCGYNDWKRRGLTEAPLVLNVPGEFALALLDGRNAIKDAWWTRNTGQADRFRQKIQEAREKLEKAASIDPLHPDPPTGMIEVAILTHMPRDQMEKWFYRAMLSNPDNLDACIVKVNYLLPAWGNGTFDDVVAFGRECLAQGHFDTRVPLALILAHSVVADQSGAGDVYYTKPDVWKDIQSVYESLLKQTPGNLSYRSSYMKYAVLAGQWEVAADQRQAIGDQPDLKAFKTFENFRELCTQIEKHVPPSSTTRPSAR